MFNQVTYPHSSFGIQFPPQVPNTNATISTYNTTSTPINLTTSFANLLSSTITTTSTGYLFGQASIQIVNATNTDHLVTFYLVVDGDTGNTTQEYIFKATGGSSYTNLSLLHRTTTQIPAGTYTIVVWGKVDTLTGGNTQVDHIDMIGFGNLS